MKGSTVVKKLNPEKKIYNERIKDDPRFPNHQFIIEPLNGLNGEKFFYVKQVNTGIEVMGEAYICSPQAALQHVKGSNANVQRIVFLATDESGEIYRGDAQTEALSKIIGKNFREEHVYR